MTTWVQQRTWYAFAIEPKSDAELIAEQLALDAALARQRRREITKAAAD
jgi:hypothetical protein